MTTSLKKISGVLSEVLLRYWMWQKVRIKK